MPRSLSASTRFPAGRVSSRVSRVPVQCWAASTGWPGASRRAVTWRRSAPQQLVPLDGVGAGAGRVEPGAAGRGRGGPARRTGRCHIAGRRGWCRRRSSPAARPAATGRPARPGTTGSTGTRAAAPAPAAGSGPGQRHQGARRAVRPGARGGAAPGPGCRPPGRQGCPGMCQPSAVTSVPTVTWWRRARASSQLSRASPGTGGTRSGSVRAGGAHEAAARGLPRRAGAADSRPAAKAAASWRRACSEASSIRTRSSSAAVRFSCPDRIAVRSRG